MTSSSVAANDIQRRRGLNLLGAFVLATQARVWGRFQQECGLSPSAAAAVVGLRTFERRDVSIGGLAAIIGLTHSATVRLIDRLEAADFVARDLGNDGREVLLKLTDEGRSLADRLLQAREQVLGDVIGSIDRATLESLSTILDELLRTMTRSRREAHWICRVCDHGVCHGSGGCPVDEAATELGQ
jgi:MarR family transcriptional repressor of emrRAB